MQIEQRHTVAGLLRANTEDKPDSTMLVDGADRYTWSEHLARASRVGHALRSDGLRVGSRVAFLDRNGVRYFETLFGGALTGIVNVALNWRLAPGEMAGVINDASPEVLIVHSEYAECLASMDSALPSVRRLVVIGEVADLPAAFRRREVAFEGWIADRPDTDPGHVPDAGEVSLQLYTSGTTGLPKGVMLSNRNLSAAVGAADESFRIDDSVVSLVAMPLFHIGGSGWALCAMSRGGTSVILRDVDPVRLLDLVETERITHTFVVPAVLMFLLGSAEIAGTDLSSLREVFYGASPIAEDVLVSCIKTFGCNFTQVYGMTETTGAISALVSEDHDPDGPRRHLLRSAGKALQGVELRIVDPDTGADLPVGCVGELCTRSSFNMLGYWQKPEETSATIDSGNWLRTGDAAYMDDDGYLFLHDRIKDMVVSGGENVYPAEVENALLSHPLVADAAVIGVPDSRWGEAVKAIVVRTPQQAAEEPITEEVLAAEIIEHCRMRLAHYKCPKSVDFASSLPRNPSGKVLKRELRDPYWAGRDRSIH